MHCFVSQMINDDATLKYIDGVATHWYVDGAVADDVIDMAKSSKKDLVLFLSEACKCLISKMNFNLHTFLQVSSSHHLVWVIGEELLPFWIVYF